MVSFICDECQSTLKKAKVAAHSWQCSSRSFSCIDCSARFSRDSYSGHSQCVSEAEKYQGKLYKGKKHQPQQQQHSAPLAGQKRAAQGGTEEADDDSDVKQASNKKSKQQQQTAAEEETKEQSKEHSLAEVLPSLLTESSGLRWKLLSKQARKLRPAQDKRAVEEELWAALQQHRKQLTFSWTLQQYTPT